MYGSGILTRHIYDKHSSRLVELPTGEWVHAAKVTSIYTLPLIPADKYRDKAIPDRIIIAQKGGGISLVPCKSYAEAEQEADRLAELIVSKDH